MKKICCVNDLPGVGKVALSAMIPILSAQGLSVVSLPTALVYNTLDFGQFEILDTTDYMDKTIDVWHNLNFQFDCIATGFMVNPKQIDLVKKLITNQKNEELLVVVDPIMGDEGKLYNGMSETNVEIMRGLSAMADIIIPNMTEACFLTKKFLDKSSLSESEAIELLQACLRLGAKSVVITSAKIDGKNCVIGYDSNTLENFSLEFEHIDIRFPGTGDIFSAVLVGDVLNGAALENACGHAMKTVYQIIMDNKDKEEKFFGADIERFIKEGKL